MAGLYDDPPLDEEEVGTNLVPIETIIPIPIDVDRSIKEWRDYQRLCREILDDTDYAAIRGVKARKRSGWAKLRRFYGISVIVLEEDRTPFLEEWSPGGPFLYRFVVEGRLGNRIEHGDGACESTELEGGNIAATEHNVRSKALTRAKNRVTSDLIGGGEVSAEELDNGSLAPRAEKARVRPPVSRSDPLELIMAEANAQLIAMELPTHYKTKAHTLNAIKACGHKNVTAQYFTDNHAQIVAELIDRVKAPKEEAE